MSKEYPRLLNTEMVKAVLEGRKTQTRQPMRYQPILASDGGEFYTDDNYYVFPDSAPKKWNESYDFFEFCPFGKVGDVLWIRETFYPSPKPMYRADFSYNPFNESDIFDAGSDDYSMVGEKWTPSIHMPRKAARIFLKVKRVWVERIQDISEEDAAKEGVELLRPGYWRNYIKEWTEFQLSAKSSFCTLWNSIYSTWNENPWVWASELEVIEDHENSSSLCGSAALREKKSGGES